MTFYKILWGNEAWLVILGNAYSITILFRAPFYNWQVQ